MSALVTWNDEDLGVIGPFAVDFPWWVEVEPVVAHLRQALGVPVFVLRLLTVEGGPPAPAIPQDDRVTVGSRARRSRATSWVKRS